VVTTPQVYRACLKIIPHESFTFAKIWLMAAHFEVRQKDLDAARKLLGQAIGRCAKEKLFKVGGTDHIGRGRVEAGVGFDRRVGVQGYIHLELQLGEVERCRVLYAKYLEKAPQNCRAWNDFAGLEKMVSAGRGLDEWYMSHVITQQKGKGANTGPV
jgi:crooked neck